MKLATRARHLGTMGTMTTQPSDVEIAQSHQLQPIADIAEKAGLPADALIPYGTTKAKVDITKLDHSREHGKLVLVTGVSPTPAGEGLSLIHISEPTRPY